MKLDFRGHEEVPVIYANFVTVNVSAYDFVMHLQVSADISNMLAPKPLAKLIMSPQCVKEVYKSLGHQIEQYEEKVGPIVDMEGIAGATNTDTDSEA